MPLGLNRPGGVVPASSPRRVRIGRRYLGRMASEDDVRELALALPDTVEKSSYGTPGFRVRDKLFARIREEGVLVVWAESIEEKDFLIEGDPEKFFTTPHYDGYPNVLVRLAAVDREELAELLAESARIRGGG
jgi:hypothetical protein